MKNVFTPAWAIALLALVLALTGLGARGLWEPDEGRYTNVALTMLDRGDWVSPHRSPDTGHWTKPPLTYWVLAASMGTLGRTAFAARLPSVLAYLALIALAWRTARRLAPGGEAMAALAYATMLLPFAASQLITTDPWLAVWQGLAMAAFVEARFGPPAAQRRWLALMWLGFGLGFLTKGPPALLPLLAVLVFDRLRPVPKAQRTLWLPAGLGVFLLVALPWYLWVITHTPGLLNYFLGQEVYARVASDSFGRNGEWYGWLKVYLPTLLLGSLPWTGWLLRWAAQLPASVRRWRQPEARLQDAEALLLTLWLLLPLLVFCLARSRLPLYLLPLFLPIAVLVARQWQQRHPGRLPRVGWIMAWALLLLGLKGLAARLETGKDATAWAQAIRARVPAPIVAVNALDDAPRYGLHLTLGVPVVQVALTAVPNVSRINPPYDRTLDDALRQPQAGQVWYTPQAHLPQVQAALARHGWRAEVAGAPYRGRVIFRVVRDRPPDAALSAGGSGSG
ncbi:ArnT family glycosyltransferase [Thermomonas hydrothermalis]|uniref:Dolichyl-phosphate-mannose-protein mannosyltransferase n=3 Tax=Thermomonas hydrothermalis TaxID=213588 RepID=A0A1M4U1K1_9GAMM|nr:glycosyltransferase family 39 protein [Thermomonas hydrothermalis]SHE50618.1 Dolichyl-phosphate-mannose-protein mannosyltransferase [Thermomonas hydrothermalis]